MTTAQMRGPVADYARAFDANCKRPTMPYGAYDAIEILCGELGIAPFGWQTAGWSGNGAGSGGSFHCSDGSVRRLSRWTAMFQDVHYVLNGQADRNIVTMNITPDWAWGGPYTGESQTQEDDMINWRPVHCPFDPEHPDNPNSGDAQWLLTWDGDGRPVRLFLGPGEGNFDPDFFWGLGWVQDTKAIVFKGDQARKFLELPEAVPTAPVAVDAEALADALAPTLASHLDGVLSEGDLGGQATADEIAQKILERAGSIRVKLDLSAD